MTAADFQALCNTYGFAPSRALRELIDCATARAEAAEREACAKVCDDLLANPHTGGGWSDAMIEAAVAIRARKEKQ